MGCGGSKNGGGGDPDEIKSEMKHCKVLEFDQFFRTAGEVLSGLEELREGFSEPLEIMHDLGRTDELVEPKLEEAFRVFLWSCSAHCEGKIALAGIVYEVNPPSITINCGHMNYHTWDFSDALRKIITGFTGAPGKIIEIGKNIIEVGEKATELGKDLKGPVTSAGLNPFEQAKAIANAGINLKTIAAGVAKSKVILEACKRAIAELTPLLSVLKELLTKADEVGKVAHEKKIYNIYEIFDHFQTAPKKTPEQIREEKKNKGQKKVRKQKNPTAAVVEKK